MFELCSLHSFTDIMESFTASLVKDWPQSLPRSFSLTFSLSPSPGWRDIYWQTCGEMEDTLPRFKGITNVKSPRCIATSRQVTWLLPCFNRICTLSAYSQPLRSWEGKVSSILWTPPKHSTEPRPKPRKPDENCLTFNCFPFIVFTYSSVVHLLQVLCPPLLPCYFLIHSYTPQYMWCLQQQSLWL